MNALTNYIFKAGVKGTIIMNETVRKKLMIRIQQKRDVMQQCTSIHCPRILKKLEKFKQLSWFYNITWSGDRYQVLKHEG